LFTNGEAEALKRGSGKICSETNAGLIVKVNSGRTDSEEKDWMICLQLLIWFWMTALGRGLAFTEVETFPHGRRIPMKVRLMVSITRRIRELLLLIELVQKIEFRESPLTMGKKYSHYSKNTSIFNLSLQVIN